MQESESKMQSKLKFRVGGAGLSKNSPKMEACNDGVAVGCGEDAFFYRSNTLCVADGVSQSADFGGNPAL